VYLAATPRGQPESRGRAQRRAIETYTVEVERNKMGAICIPVRDLSNYRPTTMTFPSVVSVVTIESPLAETTW